MNTWETLIGHERERQLLDLVMDIAFSLKACDSSTVTFEWLCGYIVDC